MARHRKKSGHEDVPAGLEEIRELMNKILQHIFESLDEPSTADLAAFCKARTQFMRVVKRILRKG